MQYNENEVYFDDDYFNKVVDSINKCVNKWYLFRNKFLFSKDDEINDFKPCCTNEEKDILKKCIFLLLDNTDFEISDIYAGVIEYYYSTIILEYYVLSDTDFRCFQSLNRYMPNIFKVINAITTSDESWASKVRRDINFAAIKGGKRLKLKCGNKNYKKTNKRSNKRNNNKTYKKTNKRKHKYKK